MDNCQRQVLHCVEQLGRCQKSDEELNPYSL